MALYGRRPLPVPPDSPRGGWGPPSPMSAADVLASSPSYFASRLGYSPLGQVTPSDDDYGQQGTATLRGGTLLHKGFYDLLSIIPAPSPSRFWRSTPPPAQDLVAGPRYDDIKAPIAASPDSPKANVPSPRKGRRISKDMVSSPTGFKHLVHASDAYQAEALLMRWGPDGVGKLGDPRWADPIKRIVRDRVQAKAVAEVVAGLKPTESMLDVAEKAPLRVVNGMSTPTASTATSANPASRISPVTPTAGPVDGLPGLNLRTSTIRWAGGLQPHSEKDEEAPPRDIVEEPERAPTPPPKKPITPSLLTLEKAVSCRIYFENLYFPLLRQAPSREQRKLALEKDMTNLGYSENQKEFLRERWRENETIYLREQRRRVDPSAFVKLKTIGHGAFGVVSLVRERGTGYLFAMKQLRKTDMLRKGQEGHVRAERDVLKSAALVSSPTTDWIVKLFYSFQDRDHLYLVLEFMGGGDLLNLLIERDVFEEGFTRFYIAEMILAVEQCHKHGFIHRDIKPDNFLFDPDGHIKLSDFGLATDLHWAHDTSYYEQQRKDLLRKHGIDLDDGAMSGDGSKTRRLDKKEVDRIMGGEGEGGVFTWREKNRKKLAYSVCGTNSYMSPEVIRGHGYSFSCDWWSLGVIMFECLYGYPPFVSNSRHVTRQKILNWRQALKFPSRPRVSHEGINLMEQLLCEPEDRLGSQAASSSVSRPNSVIMQARRSGFMNFYSGERSVDGAMYIKAHPWFRGIDWENIRKYPAPFRPELHKPDDTRHFDTDIPAEPLAPANGAAADATRDPMLLNKTHGADILEMRKALAFAGFTHKSPRAITTTRVPIDQIYPESGTKTVRGRRMERDQVPVGKGRALSM